MQFSEKQIKAVKRGCLAAQIYQTHHINDPIHQNQFKDSLQSLICFIRNYAYERKGVATAYSNIGEQAIKKELSSHSGLIDLENSEMVWKAYKDIARNNFNKLKLNEKLNPLNYNDGILTIMCKKQIDNLSLYMLDLIKNGHTRKAHEILMSVCGIGPKIASFYLRDLAYLGKLNEDKIVNLHYLQPIDTWIDQALSIILKEVPKKLEDKQKQIIELCEKANVSTIDFNQGMWVTGSLIAKDFGTLNEILIGDSANSIIDDRIDETESYLSELKRIRANWLY